MMGGDHTTPPGRGVSQMTKGETSTKQVLMTLKRAQITTIDFGNWGPYSLRAYVFETLQFFTTRLTGRPIPNASVKRLCVPKKAKRTQQPIVPTVPKGIMTRSLAEPKQAETMHSKPK